MVDAITILTIPHPTQNSDSAAGVAELQYVHRFV